MTTYLRSIVHRHDSAAYVLLPIGIPSWQIFGTNTASALVDILPLKTNQLSNLSPKSNWWVHKGLLVSVNYRSLPDKVDFARLQPLGLFEKLPDEK